MRKAIERQLERKKEEERERKRIGERLAMGFKAGTTRTLAFDSDA
jgi:hypothetical protein